MNRAFCNSCGRLVPSRRVRREGKVFLVKDCPDCGPTETYISCDAERHFAKRDLDAGHQYRGCNLNCPGCDHQRRPMYTFVNVTNGCNLNCPICCDNVPSLGFPFEPPLEYFDKIFKHLSQYENPKPTIVLFGGEPTVREDLFDIIALARSYGFRTRVLTNALKLADERYCRKLVESRTTIGVSYDGKNTEMYRTLRGTDRIIRLKQKAIENLSRIGKTRRVRAILISCLAKGLNEGELPELLELCHEHRHIFRDIYLMPLAHMWKKEDWGYEPDRMTTEDVECLVDEAFPDYRIDFLPVGFLAQFQTVAKYIGKSPVPYRGAHPNCESSYFLISNGEKYLPLTHYLKGTFLELARTFVKVEERLAGREKRWEKAPVGRALGRLRLKEPMLRLLGLADILLGVLRHVRLGRLFQGKGPAKLLHAALVPIELLVGRKPSKVMASHTEVQGHLHIMVLPLEDNYMLETDRLERCPTLHAYYDPRSEQVKYVPVCAWRLHNVKLLRNITDYYSSHASAGTS